MSDAVQDAVEGLARRVRHLETVEADALSNSGGQIGEVLFCVDGERFTAELPLTGIAGWLVNADGTLLIV